MKNTNGKTRILLTYQEINAILTLAGDRLRGEVTPRLRDETLDETLGGLLIKLGRASKRVQALG